MKIQNIDVTDFETKFSRWLACNTKKNTIAFIGQADTGKSVFLSKLHENFRFSNRLTTDGIFTFANCINADCVYHEEPFITPETCETAKLVYEGNQYSTVAVKNKGAQRLNKKIPVLISANHPIYKYCSGQKDAFDARLHVFKPNFKLNNHVFCDSNTYLTHKCIPLNIDIKRRAYKSVHGHSGEDNIWLEAREEDYVQSTQLPISDTVNIEHECGLIHNLKKHHWRTFICYIILKYKIIDLHQILIREIVKTPEIGLTNIDPTVDFYGLDYKSFVKILNFQCINLL